MLKYIIITICVVGFVESFFWELWSNPIIPVREFNGHKVYRVVPETLEQLDVLKWLEADNDLDFWTDAAIYQNVDIMIQKDKVNEILNTFKEYEIQYQVMIEDVETLVAAERHAIENHKPSRRFDEIDWYSYYSYDEIIAWADSLDCGENVDISSQVYGSSSEGRDLKVYKFTNGSSDPNPRPSMWVDGTFHAREWISPATVTYFMNDLCRNPSNTFLNDVDIYVVPIVNPDYEFSTNFLVTWTECGEKQERITIHPLDASVLVYPNRNFEFKFGGNGTSNDKCSNNYRGPNAWSEPEVRSLAEYLISTTNSADWRAYITVHSYGQYILIPYSFDNETFPADFPEMENLATDMESAMKAIHGTPFTVGHSGSILGPTSGCADDWAYEVANITYSYTYELRDTGRFGFLLPAQYIIPTAEETLEGLKYAARFITL
ncbi:carboxypeptidase B-like [Folsomia candida]|nr:carboxypeptidase B-like [Folsomia candida]